MMIECCPCIIHLAGVDGIRRVVRPNHLADQLPQPVVPTSPPYLLDRVHTQASVTWHPVVKSGVSIAEVEVMDASLSCRVCRQAKKK
mmetsp:Transcript_148370/g.259323  ORF Transcript_148370/g.259323 Transcript_148370/m.259323 type:complete len:87 (-) Transcript_148370:480-740(-)